jgi:hypothetical protein
MTISSTTNTVSYTGNGSTTAFAVPYVFFGTGTTSEIQVVEVVIATGVETVKSNGSDFTVSGGSGTTGTVTAATAPASTVKWVINRATTQTQETDYVENDPFPAESHEEALDRLTAIDQEQQRALDRTAQLPDGYTGSFDPTLPTAITGSTVLAFNAGATAFEIGPTTAAISAAAAEAAAAAVSANDAAASAAAAATSETNAANSETAAAASAASIGLTTRGDLLTRGASANERLAIGGADTVLLTDGTDPAWGQVSLTAGVTGTLPLANGGTGATVAATALSNLGGISPSATSNLTAGFTTDLNAIGNSGTGTQTVSLTLECLQTLTINGSFTLAPPASGNGIAIIYATNDGTGGYTMTTSGFTKVTGTYNSTAAAVNRLQVEKVGALTTLIITDLTP